MWAPINLLKLTAGFLFVGLTLILAMLILIPLLPWHRLRIVVTNHVGTFMGSVMVRYIAGCKVTVDGLEHRDAQHSAIFAGNHTTTLDAFTSIWLSPTGTVGVAKREIIYYPFYGLAWLLAGHLTLDRRSNSQAVRSMRKMGRFVRENRLSMFLWPEGTRSLDGRLLPFKKGVVHLAIQTGLPIVPMVTSGAHRTWERASLRIRSVPFHVRFLPPIDTTHWTVDQLEQHLEELRQRFIDALPQEQKPIPVTA